MSITFVIGRYNESLDFLLQKPFCSSRVFIYNKGPKITEEYVVGNSNIIITNLPNVGREGHSYLYHIINEYENLDELICFLPASWRAGEMSLKYFRAIKTIKLLQETNNTCMVVFDGDTDRLSSIYDFQLDNYLSDNENNRSINPDDSMLLSTVRPFGKWYETYIGKDVPIRSDAMQGVFGIRNEHILQRDKLFYKILYNQVSTHQNPEVGHYLERAWPSIFLPYPPECFFHVDRYTFQDIHI